MRVVAELESIADEKISAILDIVAPVHPVRAEHLERLLAKSPDSWGVSAVMRSMDTREKLKAFLDDDVSDKVIGQMYDAL